MYRAKVFPASAHVFFVTMILIRDATRDGAGG